MLTTAYSSPHYLAECLDQTFSPPRGPLISSCGERARIGRESPDFSGSSPPASPAYWAYRPPAPVAVSGGAACRPRGTPPPASCSQLARAASCARRRRLSSCHSGYIGPGHRNGIKPRTTTPKHITHAAARYLRASRLSGNSSSSIARKPPTSIIIPAAGVINDSVLRPRSNQAFERSL